MDFCLGSVGDERGARRQGMDLGMGADAEVVMVDLRRLRVGLDMERKREAIGDGEMLGEWFWGLGFCKYGCTDGTGF